MAHCQQKTQLARLSLPLPKPTKYPQVHARGSLEE
jgi:hypothetical protein